MRVVTVTAPSRLHFGLINDFPGGRYGGIGLMVDQPRTEVRLEPAAALEVSGIAADRARAAVAAWHGIAAAGLAAPWQHSSTALPVRLTVRHSPPPHRGLGSGTQLVLSVAVALQRWFLPTQPLTETSAVALGRARRSAIGTHGFFRGGLIVDGGQPGSQTLGSRHAAPPWPAAWRIVIAIPRAAEGPSGSHEESLFGELPTTPPDLAARLTSQLHEQLLPALAAADFARFSEALYEYGYAAGLQFAAVQGGAYNGPTVRRVIEAVRAAGVVGTGQSSWGPAVFAVVDSAAAAQHLRQALAGTLADLHLDLSETTASRAGHQVSDRMAG